MPTKMLHILPASNPALDALDAVMAAGLFWFADNHNLDTWENRFHDAILPTPGALYTGTSFGFYSDTDFSTGSFFQNANIAGTGSFPAGLQISQGRLGGGAVWAGPPPVPPHGSDALRACYGLAMSNNDGAYAGGLVMGGDSLYSRTGSFNLASGGGDVAVTGLGFQPQCVIILTGYPQSVAFQGYQTSLGNVFGHWMCIGVATGTGAGESWCVAEYGRYQSPSGRRCAQNGFSKFTEDAVSVGIADGGTCNPSQTHQCELASFDPDGFTLSQSTPPGGNIICAYLALADPFGFFQAGIDFSPTADSSVTVTDLDGDVQGVFFASESSVDDNIYNYSALSMGGGDGTDQGACVQAAEMISGTDTQPAAYTTQSASIIMASGNGPLIEGLGSLSGLGAGTFTLDWTATDGTARKFGYLAWGVSDYTIITDYESLPADPVTMHEATLNGDIDVGPINEVDAHPVTYWYEYWRATDPTHRLQTTKLHVTGTGVVDIPFLVVALNDCDDHEFTLFLVKDGCDVFVTPDQAFTTLCVSGFVPQIYRQIFG